MRLALLALVGLLVAGCGAARVGDGPLRVDAAASLQDVLPALAAASAASGGPELQATFDGSSRLRVQIAQGAPVDLFLSADAANVDALLRDGIGVAPGVDYAANRVVLVVPAADARLEDWKGLADPGLRLVAAADGVPIATYADEVVAQLARLPAAPPGFAAGVAANTVSREDNVRAVLAKVELGEADAAFVYATDARATSRVRILPLPAGATVRAVYRGLVTASGAQAEAADGFLRWLTGARAQGILAAAGFEAPA